MSDTRAGLQPQDLSLHGHLLAECLAMVKYALASGLKVPGGLAQALESIVRKHSVNPRNAAGPNPKARDPDRVEPIASVDASGRWEEDVRKLAIIHGRLAQILAPATPRTVLLLENEANRGGLWSFLGPVGLIRRMMSVAIFSLVALIGISLSPHVDTESISQGIFSSSGNVLLLNLLFLLTAASLGAAFAGLFLANRYIANGTFDPKFESSYWIRFVLGLMAGIIMSQLIPIEFENPTSESTHAAALKTFAKPVLATLGGFSAAAVYRILDRFVDAIESLVRGDTHDAIAARDMLAKARLSEQLAENRLRLAARLTEVQQKIGSSPDPETMKRELDDVLGGLVSHSRDDSIR